MIPYRLTHAIYQEGEDTIQSSVYWEGTIPRAAYTAPRPFDAKTDTNHDKNAHEHLRDLNETRKPGENAFKLMLLCDALPQIVAAENEKHITLWREISKETWWEALECLPPVKWKTERGVEIFYVSEAYTSNIYQFYARLRTRYFTRRCRNSEAYSVLAREVAEFVKNNPESAHV